MGKDFCKSNKWTTEELSILKKYSLVCQAPVAEPYTVCAYTGTDLSQVVGISMADSMPEGSYGWMQQCGNAYINVSGETKPAYADFRPNDATFHATEESPKDSKKQSAESATGEMDEESIARHKDERLSQLPPLLIEAGPYCDLLREARDVFVDGHFYACVAMCGISFERFQRDKAKSYGAKKKQKIWQIRELLKKNKAVSPETIKLCEAMADLRNNYAHGHGLKPKEDARRALQWMHSFIDHETNLMRNYVIVDGVLKRNCTAG